MKESNMRGEHSTDAIHRVTEATTAAAVISGSANDGCKLWLIRVRLSRGNKSHQLDSLSLSLSLSPSLSLSLSLQVIIFYFMENSLLKFTLCDLLSLALCWDNVRIFILTVRNWRWIYYIMESILKYNSLSKMSNNLLSFVTFAIRINHIKIYLIFFLFYVYKSFWVFEIN